MDRVSRVQAQIAGVAVGNKGAEPFVGDIDGQLPELYFTRNQLKQRLKHKQIRCQIEIEPTRKVPNAIILR